MHRTVWFVFKVLAYSMFLMIILNISTVAIDSLAVNSKVEALSIVMQNEIARNNCVPKSITPLFKRQLDTIVQQSNVAIEVKSNIEDTVTIEGNRYEAIDEEHVKDYGDIQVLSIGITMNPSRISNVERGTAASHDGSLLRKIRDHKYVLDYQYTVPCLRYLK